MLIFAKDNKQYIFIHIPKTSGRYIRGEIFKKMKCYHITDINIPSSTIIDVPPNHFYHFTYKTIKNYEASFTELTNNYKYITFVRNPYHRLISSFFFIKKMSHMIEFSIHNLSNITMEQYIDSLANEFKNFIKTELLEQINNNLNYGYKFFIPQYNYLVDQNNNIPNDIIIYRLEDYTIGSEAEQFFGFEGFELKTYDLTKFYDNESLALMNDYYSKDFELFGYDKITNI